MINIPQNDSDNSKSHMDKFVEYVLKRFATDGSAELYSAGSICYSSSLPYPGITEGEARQLARLFAEKGYHASAYFVHGRGFSYVTISKYVQDSSYAAMSHTEKWA